MGTEGAAKIIILEPSAMIAGSSLNSETKNSPPNINTKNTTGGYYKGQSLTGFAIYYG